MRVIRKTCFETNSSSTHSLVITNNLYGQLIDNNKIKLTKSDKTIYDFESIQKHIKDGIITLTGDTFSREDMRFVISSWNKLNYFVTFIFDCAEDDFYSVGNGDYFKNLLFDILKKAYPDLKEVKYEYDKWNHIDHDGVSLAYTIFKSDNIKLKDFGVFSLYEFIFNTSYIFLSGEYAYEYDQEFYNEHYTDKNEIKKNQNDTIILTANTICSILDTSECTEFTNIELRDFVKNNIKLYLSHNNSEEKINELTLYQ